MEEVDKSCISAVVADDLLEQVVQMAGDFPAPPAILTRIIELTDDPATPVEEIAGLLSSEPAVATRVLKQSNSAFYGRSRQIHSVQEAVVLLGFYTIRSLVVATMAHGLYMRSTGAKHFRYTLWEHSLATAIACRMAAHELRVFNPEVAYLAGLLHDVGKLVMLERRPERYVELCSGAADAAAAIQVETENFGFSHPLVGAVLLDRWLFPEQLVEAVLRHHEEQDFGSIAGLVAFADAFVSVHGRNLFSVAPETLQQWGEDCPVNVEEWETNLSEQKALFETG